MPLTPTGTNLLGVVKHLAGVEAEYFGACLGRPWPEPMAFWADDAEPNADMWATEDESPAEILDLYRRVTAFADETIEPLPLDAPASVPWWRTPETDLHTLLVHMAVETARHAGQLDILREQLDGVARSARRPDEPARRRRGLVGGLRGQAARHRRAVGLSPAYFLVAWAPAPSEVSAAMKASGGTSTDPMFFIRFLPAFCFSSSLRLREMSPP